MTEEGVRPRSVVLVHGMTVDGEDAEEHYAGQHEISFHILAIQRVMRREIQEGNAGQMTLLVSAFFSDLPPDIFDH